MEIKQLFENSTDGKISRQISVTEKWIKKFVPQGHYCYDSDGLCPFWDRFSSYPEQGNGYCGLMERGDWMAKGNGGTFLLWDQCKECGINENDEDVAAK